MRLPSTLPAMLRAAGLTVVELPGWQTRERPPSTGGFKPVGVLNHHTGASALGWDRAKELAYATWLATEGRSDLPPPLVQIALGRSATVYLCAAGRSNHAGTAKASGSVAAGDGNTLYCGIEWMLSGTEAIPPAMMEAGATLNAVLTYAVTETSVESISCHFQTSVTGKWDIGDPNGVTLGSHKVLDVPKFRARVQARREAIYPSPVDPEVPVPGGSKIKRVQIIKKVRLDGTIDGHDPLLATFRILGPKGWFRLTVVTVNWGRGYGPGEFKRNVEAVIEKTAEKHYVVLLLQEIDEADPAQEHTVIKGEVPAGSTFVKWSTREPIIAWPGIRVPLISRRKVMTMDQGSAIGAPHGTGPRRFLVSCIGKMEGVRIWFGNQHPHKRNDASTAVKIARKRGERVTRTEVERGLKRADMAIYGGDMNDLNYPKSHPREKTAMEHGLDTIRYVVG